jgi:hypothetical protein
MMKGTLAGKPVAAATPMTVLAEVMLPVRTVGTAVLE